LLGEEEGVSNAGTSNAQKRAPRMNFLNEGSDPYETPRSMPYDSYDLKSH